MKKTTSYFLHRFYLKYHAYLIIAGTSLAGFTASKVLLRFGEISTPSLRYTLSAVIGYIVFLILMYTWMRFIKDQLNIDDQAVLSKYQQPNDQTISMPTNYSNSPITDTLNISDVADGEAALSLLFVVGLLLFSFIFIFELPIIIIELFLSAMTASIFNSSIKKFDENTFVFSLISNTLFKAIFIIFLYFLIGIGLEKICPDSVKITDLFTSGCIK